MNASRTARDRARAELTSEIKNEARRQLAIAGADGMSLRAVARELGMVSSAVYRYFPSRDELLTALIIDAYQALGDAVEAAETAVARADLAGRWAAICRGARTWAIGQPHEYALIYGSPVPGYQAPPATTTQAIRLPLLIVDVLRDGWAAGSLVVPADEPPLSPVLAEQIARVAEAIGVELPGSVLTRALIAWSQLFGMLSFELFGQFVGSVQPANEFFDHTVALMATFTGLPSECPATA
jgi:AcrR family transcriptional regulator